MSAEDDDESFFAALLTTLDGDLADALDDADGGVGADALLASVDAWGDAGSLASVGNESQPAALIDALALSPVARDSTAEFDACRSEERSSTAAYSSEAGAADSPALVDAAASSSPINSVGNEATATPVDGAESVVAPASIALGGARNGAGSFRRRRDPNKARNERAKQIRGLKGEVAELTAQLKMLQTLAVRENRGATDGATDSAGGSDALRAPLSMELLGAPLVWEAICRNQLSRRARSERENARLKRALEKQLRLANSLERELKKPFRAMRTTGDMDLCASKRVYSLPSDSDADAKIFELLLAEADAAYFEVDGILALNGLAGAETEPIRGAQMRDGDHGGRFLDMFSSNVLPFSLEATAEVVWRFHSGTGKHRGPLYYKTAKMLETSQDTVIEKFAVELFSSTTRADFRFWQVIRRYVEDDRVVVVWMALVEPVEVANNAFSSCAFRERGYTVCKRESLGPTPFTRFQQCLRFEPYTTHAADKLLSEREKREIGAIIEFMLSQDSVRVYLETLEDELVRASLHVPSPGAS